MSLSIDDMAPHESLNLNSDKFRSVETADFVKRLRRKLKIKCAVEYIIYTNKTHCRLDFVLFLWMLENYQDLSMSLGIVIHTNIIFCRLTEVRIFYNMF